VYVERKETDEAGVKRGEVKTEKGNERRHCGGAGSAFETGDTYVHSLKNRTGSPVES
jgi:hypothetical protein